MSRHECDWRDDEGLEALGTAVRDSFEPMSAEARARVRSRVLEGIGAERVPFLVRFGRPLIALAVGASMVGGVSAAAAASDPGDLLYPLKRSAAAVVTSFDRPVQAPALKPVETPAKTPAAAVEPATRRVPAGSAPSSAVGDPAGRTLQKKTDVVQPPASQPGRGKKPSNVEKHKAPDKQKSQGKAKTSSAHERSVRPASASGAEGNGRTK